MVRFLRRSLLALQTLLTSWARHPAWRALPIWKSLSLPHQWFLFGLASLMVFLFYMKFHFPSHPPPAREWKEIVVEVEGEVRKPGIYTFSTPPHLKEVIEEAGGLRERAWMDEEDSSIPLASGALITVQSVLATSMEGTGKGEGRTIRIKIGTMEARKLLLYHLPLDLNRVSVEDLCLLPGIGESLAREIIAYRERRKGFRSVEELKQVKGIGEKKWEILKPFLTVNLG